MKITSDPGRTAGLLYLAMIVLGVFSILYVPSKLIVAGDPSATARNILASEMMYRLSVVSGLASAIVFLFLGRALYRLLHEVNEGQASLMVILMAIAVAIGFAMTVNDLAALGLLLGTDFFAAVAESQREALAMLFLGVSRQGILLSQIFWGLWLFPFGVLVMRSGFLPWILGLLLIANGAAYLAPVSWHCCCLPI